MCGEGLLVGANGDSVDAGVLAAMSAAGAGSRADGGAGDDDGITWTLLSTVRDVMVACTDVGECC